MRSYLVYLKLNIIFSVVELKSLPNPVAAKVKHLTSPHCTADASRL